MCLIDTSILLLILNIALVTLVNKYITFITLNVNK